MTDRSLRVRAVWRRVHYVWVRVGLASLVAMPVAAFLMFRAQGLPPDTWSDAPDVAVRQHEEYLAFTAKNSDRRERVVIFPGCPVEAAAYAPLARSLAVRGLTAMVIKIPYRCAPFTSHAATLTTRTRNVLDSCSACAWTIVGHSRGARHALDLVAAMPQRFARLVLLGSTHPRERDFSEVSVPVMKAVATNDGVAPVVASEANRRLLPASVRWEVIEGGNHAQFAYYGFQLFDGRATISREEQHVQVVMAIESFVLAVP
jgi:dienelactone hydrolase